MTIENKTSRKLRNIRWVARIWTIPVVILALIAVLNPNPGVTGEEVPWLASFFLIMYAIAVLGLVIGWRWELAGGLLTIITLVMRDTLYLIMLGNWVENLIFVWIPLIPPAVLFLLAWRMEKIAKGQWGD